MDRAVHRREAAQVGEAPTAGDALPQCTAASLVGEHVDAPPVAPHDRFAAHVDELWEGARPMRDTPACS